MVMVHLVCYYGLDLLWSYIQDSSTSSGTREEVDEAVDHIVALVEFVEGRVLPTATPSAQLYGDTRPVRGTLFPGEPGAGSAAAALALKHQLLQRCMDNLEANTSAPQSLKLMRVRGALFAICIPPSLSHCHV
jgi:hypothetical protein